MNKMENDEMDVNYHFSVANKKCKQLFIRRPARVGDVQWRQPTHTTHNPMRRAKNDKIQTQVEIHATTKQCAQIQITLAVALCRLMSVLALPLDEQRQKIVLSEQLHMPLAQTLVPELLQLHSTLASNLDAQIRRFQDIVDSRQLQQLTDLDDSAVQILPFLERFYCFCAWSSTNRREKNGEKKFVISE